MVDYKYVFAVVHGVENRWISTILFASYLQEYGKLAQSHLI